MMQQVEADESDDHISVFLSVTEGGRGQIMHVLIFAVTLLLSPHCCCYSRVQRLAPVPLLWFCVGGCFRVYCTKPKPASCPSLAW